LIRSIIPLSSNLIPVISWPKLLLKTKIKNKRVV
jgi:hypothetical protein